MRLISIGFIIKFKFTFKQPIYYFISFLYSILPSLSVYLSNNNNQMNTVYVLVPLCKIDSKTQIISKATQLLHIDSKFAQQTLTLHQINSKQYALQIADFDLNFLQINNILEESQQNQLRLQMLQSVLKDYQYNSGVQDQEKSENMGQLQKKIKKYQSLKQQNKKLKKLLQVQLQNTQKVREQTQKTMKILRQQFDALVIQMTKRDKSSIDFLPINLPQQAQLNQGPAREKSTFTVTNATKHSSIR